MAEFLIFIRNAHVADISGHWMDAQNIYERLQAKIDSDSIKSKEKKIKEKENLSRKYMARSQPGDIAEVRPDGFFCEPSETTGHGWNHNSYALIRCPAMPYVSAIKYMQPWRDTADHKYPMLIRKRRYSFVTLGISAGEIRTISSLDELVGFITDKATRWQ